VRARRIEQVVGPRRVYRHPATRFVAEFIGDNNVFEGRVTNELGSGGETKGSAASVAVDGIEERFEIPTTATIGTTVTFCVRPGRLRVGGGENRFQARVEGSEFLGDVTRVRLEYDGRPIVLRTTDRDLPTGEVELGFDPTNAHVIDE
jgi:thiamine transport system ATP-binding protein